MPDIKDDGLLTDNDERADEMAEKIEDSDTPFSDPDDVDASVPDTHPATDYDSDIDSHERYDEGIWQTSELKPYT